MRLLPLVLLVSAALPARAGDVVLVDPSGGDGVTLLQLALAAAAPGDTLLLAEGEYDGPNVVYEITEGVTILPAPGAPTPTLRRLDIHDVWAGQTVVLRGLSIGGPTSDGPFAPLHVVDCDGAVWLEDCSVRGADAVHTSGPFPGGGQGTTDIRGGSEAFFRNCTFQGGRGADAVPAEGAPFAGGGGDALLVDAFSEVVLLDCELIGGDAGDGPSTSTFSIATGGDALLADGDATIAGCVLQGGAEGAGNDAQPSTSGRAIKVFMATAGVRVLSSTLLAGPVQGAGTVAPAIEAPPGKVLLLSEPARSLELPDQVREGGFGTLALDGEPGDVVWVLFSADATLTPLLGQKGTLVMDLGSMLGPLVLGVLPGPDGKLDIPFQLHDLPPGIESIPTFVQGVFLDGDGSMLGGASAMTWIDGAF